MMRVGRRWGVQSSLPQGIMGLLTFFTLPPRLLPPPSPRLLLLLLLLLLFPFHTLYTHY
jgi:hypothetical protein